MATVREGDLVEIPLPAGRIAVGWILHVSKRFKNAFGFIVFGIKGETNTSIEWDAEGIRPERMNVFGPLYTHVDVPAHFGWRVVENHPLTAAKRSLTRRRVGGGVYIGDEYIGPVGVEDAALPQMSVTGMPGIVKELETAFPRPLD